MIEDPEMRLNATEIGNRLFKIRFILDYGGEGQQKDFAEEARLPPKSYSHWETGRILLPLGHALQIVDVCPGLTLDFIYRGDLDFLPPRLARRLREAPDRKPTKRGRAAKSPR